MASYIYDFYLHCKGEKQFIDEFHAGIGKEIKDDYADSFVSSESKSPFAMYFGGAGWRSAEFYTPFMPLMNKFTDKTGKPLSFFFELTREQNSSDSSLRCGYAIFEDGTCIETKYYTFGTDSRAVKQAHAAWLGIEDETDENAVNEDWRGEVEYQLENILDDMKDIEHVDPAYITR